MLLANTRPCDLIALSSFCSPPSTSYGAVHSAKILPRVLVPHFPLWTSNFFCIPSAFRTYRLLQITNGRGWWVA